LFKMWSLQTPDGKLSLSVLQQGIHYADDEVALGFLNLDGQVAPASEVTSTAAYDANGVQSAIELNVRDALGRQIQARMPQMHSYLGSGSWDSFWGYEGVGNYLVDGFGVVP